MADNPFIKARDAVDALHIKEASALGGAAGARDEKALVDAENRLDIKTAVVQNFKVDGDVLASAVNKSGEALDSLERNYAKLGGSAGVEHNQANENARHKLGSDIAHGNIAGAGRDSIDGVITASQVNRDVVVNAGQTIAHGLWSSQKLANDPINSALHSTATNSLDFLEKSTLAGAGVKFVVDEASHLEHPAASAGGAKPIAPASKTPGK